MKILLAVDGSEYTKKMLAYLVTHEDLLQPKNDYTIVTVHAPLPNRVKSVVGKEQLDSYYSEECEKILGPVSKFLVKHNIEANSIWKVGPIGETVAALANKGKYDLLVMGSHGRGKLASMVMGSVATQVLAESQVPLLLVR
jgi:nucleotide-binding universal stress UspA family protein